MALSIRMVNRVWAFVLKHASRTPEKEYCALVQDEDFDDAGLAKLSEMI